MALEERNRARSWCARQLSEMRSNDNDDNDSIGEYGVSLSPVIPAPATSTATVTATISARHKIAQFRDSFSQLQKRLDYLRRECVNLSVSLASKNMSNDERRMHLGIQKNRITMARQELRRLSNSVLFTPASTASTVATNSREGTPDNNNSSDPNHAGGTLNDALHTRVQEVKKKRFHLALQAFEMHRMDVGTEYNNLTLSDFLQHTEDRTQNEGNILYTSQFKRRIREKVISGIGKIGGLPLPHRGALYKVLRSDVLTSSLRLVASLTQLLARCLGILLPRPILLRPTLANTLNASTRNRKVAGLASAFNFKECRLKHQTDDIITDVTSKPDWHKLQKKGGLSSNRSPNYITTMQDLEELGEKGCVQNNTTQCSSSSNVASNDTSSHFTQRATSTIASTSTNSLLSLVGSSSNLFSRAFDKMKGHQNQHHNSRSNISDIASIGGITNVSMASTSMDDLSVSVRLRHASCAIICNNIIGNVSSMSTPKDQQRSGTGSSAACSAATHYELQPPQYSSNTTTTGALDRKALNQQDKSFTMGLRLLQNNIMALSVQAGVPDSALWPAEAILLNLHSLKLFCMEQNSE